MVNCESEKVRIRTCLLATRLLPGPKPDPFECLWTQNQAHILYFTHISNKTSKGTLSISPHGTEN